MTEGSETGLYFSSFNAKMQNLAFENKGNRKRAE